MGNLLGHVLPAVFFLLVGLTRAAIFMRRARRSLHTVTEATAGEQRALGVIIGAASTIELLGEATHPLHLVAVLGYLLAAGAFLLESCRRLPPGASSGGLALALLVQYVLFHAHAEMFRAAVERTAHRLLANFCLVSSASSASVVFWPSSVLTQAALVVGLLMVGLYYGWIGFALYCPGVYPAVAWPTDDEVVRGRDWQSSVSGSEDGEEAALVPGLPTEEDMYLAACSVLLSATAAFALTFTCVARHSIEAMHRGFSSVPSAVRVEEHESGK